MKFKLGQTVMTRSINETIIENSTFAKEITEAFQKYCSCDWGDTCKEDWEMNDLAVKHDVDRIVALYKTSQGKVFIITEWDRSYTTIMFGSEY